MLGPGVPFVLRTPAEGPLLFATQEVSLQLPGGRKERLIASLENDADHMNIVASSPMGQTLFILQLSQGTVRLDARVPLPKAFDPRLLPALLQFTNWPLEEVRKGLGAGAELHDDQQTRSLHRKGQIILTLQREGEAPPYRRITLAMPLASIRAIITTLEDQP